jgi:hypothetical protein
MGNAESHIKTVNFDNVKYDKHMLIHVMDEKDQSLLIKGTLTIEDEIKTLNSVLSASKQGETRIIIYGKNTDDYGKVMRRYKQLTGLGFDACVYFGGLFEWLLLQEIYGISEFPIEKREITSIDVLKYAPAKWREV